jgi:hypothetical protein
VHTDIPTRADLEQLLSVRDAVCVSIYLPTAPEEHGERLGADDQSSESPNDEEHARHQASVERSMGEVSRRRTLALLSSPLVEWDVSIARADQSGDNYRLSRSPDSPIIDRPWGKSTTTS